MIAGGYSGDEWEYLNSNFILDIDSMQVTRKMTNPRVFIASESLSCLAQVKF